jgi:hypothetical protein
MCLTNLFIAQCAEAKAGPGKTVKSSSSAGGSVVSEPKSKVFFQLSLLCPRYFLLGYFYIILSWVDLEFLHFFFLGKLKWKMAGQS